MPELIDTLITENPWSFTADNTVDKVPLTYAVTEMKSANNKKYFKNGDSFSVLSIGIIFPESFTLAKQIADETLLFYRATLLGKTSGLDYNIYALGNYNAIYLPFENFEMALDVFVNVPDQVQVLHPAVKLNEDFSIETNLSGVVNISMLGVPSTLNGKVFTVRNFMKVLHNLPLY